MDTEWTEHLNFDWRMLITSTEFTLVHDALFKVLFPGSNKVPGIIFKKRESSLIRLLQALLLFEPNERSGVTLHVTDLVHLLALFMYFLLLTILSLLDDSPFPFMKAPRYWPYFPSTLLCSWNCLHKQHCADNWKRNINHMWRISPVTYRPAATDWKLKFRSTLL